MRPNKEIRSRALSRDNQFSYLPDADRYLMHKGDPQFRFVVIGTGINGQEHIRVTHLEGRGYIYGIYDPNPRSINGAQEAHAQTGHGNRLVVYDTLDAACEDRNVDGYIICTPNYTHLDIVQRIAQTGKHILLEKPISTTAKDALEITQIASNYPAVFQLGLQYRYKAMYSEAIYEAIDRRAIGEIKMVGIQEFRMPFFDKVNQWNKFSRFSGNTLVEKCCHYFDLINLFAGARATSVYASGAMSVNFREFEYNGEKSDILDNAMVIVNYENGVRGSFNLCMFSPMFSEELTLCGDEGRIRSWEHQDFMTDMEMESYLEIMCNESKPSRKMEPGYPAWIERSGHSGATYYEHVNFIENIMGNPTNTATANEGLWSVLVALAAQESIETGRTVYMQEFLEREGISLREPELA
jgi:myo-inositol 2-dehydrogenase/D-chiro-inositol 1-dehydrogenase